jgi:hypothetical protein
LPLAQVTRAADLLYLARYPQAGFGRGIYRRSVNRDRPWPDWLLDIKGSVAPSAKTVARPELNQFAFGILAVHNFACLHARK